MDTYATLSYDKVSAREANKIATAVSMWTTQATVSVSVIDFTPNGQVIFTLGGPNASKAADALKIRLDMALGTVGVIESKTRENSKVITRQDLKEYYRIGRK